MGRVGIPTKYIFLRGLARGMVLDYRVLVGVVEETKKLKTENGKGRSGNVFQHRYIGEILPGRPLARGVVSIFSIYKQS